uniref:PGG domain-containing protein n=2 Tax=Chenopodium quinoa TaxID=63459 RepID=A0A803LBL7_CHEQI
MTVVDIYREQNRNNIKNWNVEQYLKRAKARPAKEVLKRLADGTWLEEQRTSYMVVASLTATMAFQVGVNPPGDVWQDSKTVIKKETGDNFYHIAGTSIMSYYNSKEYNNLLISNTIGLISSLSVILLLISGFPCKRYFLVILRTTLWIAVTATSFTYYLAVYALIYEGNQGVWTSLSFYLIAWQGLMGSMLLGHFVRFILKLVGWQRRQAL